MNRQVVVAKYKEDMSWLKDVPWPTVVYDKFTGVGRCDFPHVTYIEVQNSVSGREAHTYLGHILSSHSNPADVTYFLQGNPFDHYDNLWESFHYDIRETLPLSSINEAACKAHWRQPPRPSFIHRITPHPFSAFSLRTNPHWKKVRWKHVFGDTPAPSKCVYGYGAQLAVPAHRIKQRPWKFYFRLFDTLDRGEQPHLSDAWSFETLWLYIFGDSHKGGFPDHLHGLTKKCML